MHPGRMPSHGSLNHSGHNSLHGGQHHLRHAINFHRQQQFPFSRMICNFNNVAQSHPSAQALRPTGPAQSKYVDCASALNTPFFMQLQNELSLFPVDFGVDLGSVRAEIDNCKRRYHREVWNVICGKALQSGQGQKAATSETNGSGWKKASQAERSQSAERVAVNEEQDNEEQSGASGAGTTKRGQKTPSVAGGGGQRSGAEMSDEQRVIDGEEGDDEKETTEDLAMNENNRAPRQLRRQQPQQQHQQQQHQQQHQQQQHQQQHRQQQQQQQQQQPQQRPARQSSQRQQSLNCSRQSDWNDDWKNWSNSTAQRSLSNLLKLVGFSDQEPLASSIIDAATAPAGLNSTATGGAISTDEDDDDDEDEEESFGRINHSLFDDEDAFSSGSFCSSAGEGRSRRRPFTPMHCGDWSSGGFGTSELQRQRRQTLVKKRQEAQFLQQMRQLIGQTATKLTRAGAITPKGASSSDAKTAPSKQ